MTVMIVLFAFFSGTLGAGMAVLMGWTWWMVAISFILWGNLATGMMIARALICAAGDLSEKPGGATRHQGHAANAR